MEGDEIARYIPVTTANDAGKSNYGGATELLRYRNKLYLCDGFRSTIYALENQQLVTAYSFDFGNLTIPEDVNKNNYGNDFPYAWKPNFFVTGQYFIIDFIVPNVLRRHYAFMNLSSGQIKSGSINYLEDTPPFFPQKQDDKTLIGIFEYHDIETYRFITDKLLQISNPEEDTIVLVFYHLK
jgi:hypothetical protein